MVYNPKIPPEFFDVIFIDECHRSIYSVWRQVLEYFDASLLRAQANLKRYRASVLKAAVEGRLVRLRQSILKWAFEGKLVDQDPNDEPAAELLARIRAEREKAGAQKTRSRRAGRQPQPLAKSRVRSPRPEP